MPDVGDVIDGYRLDAVIGRGGMGTVYRGTDLALEKTVALKVIAPHLASDPKFVLRFREEAKALARLDAPGIVSVMALREANGALVLVMEHVDGPSLRALLQRRGALDLSVALPLLTQVVQAVQHAHESGVLHRDLKPSNILIGPDGQAKITDFGLAKIQGSDAQLTSTRERAGTVAYMSPEQIEGLRHVDERSDLFSLGLITYEVLTGQLPYDASGSSFAIQRAIVEADFSAPSSVADDVPPGLDALVGRLLAKDPADRPPNAASLAADLDAVAASVPDGSAAADLSSSAPPESASLPLWGRLAVAVAIALVGAYFGVQLALEPEPVSTALPSSGSSSTDTLAVTTSPPGATVVVDGEPAGETPLTLPVRPGPPVQVRLEKPGYVPRDTSLWVAHLATTLSPTSADTPSADRPDREAASTAASASRASGPAEATREGASSVPARRETGSLRVRSDPPGASVRLDDSVVGTAPLSLSDLLPGTYRLELRKDGYRPVKRRVQVPARDSAVVRETLTPRPAVVELRVLPSGNISIDGEVRTRNTDRWLVDSLAAGTHRLRLASSLGRWASTVTLRPGQTYQRTLDFSQTVDIAVTARTESGAPVPNATIIVDGTQAGYTPQRLSLHVGQHTLQVEKKRFRPAERVIMVEPGMQSPVVFELVPQVQ